VTRLVDTDFSWHDGVLVDLQFVKFLSKKPELQLTVDLYPDADPKSERKRYLCASKGLSRFFMKGDIPQLVKNAGSGNIDFMRINFTADTEIVVLLLFRGMVEAEAKAFTLAELKS
jgi:hypothetical protein